MTIKCLRWFNNKERPLVPELTEMSGCERGKKALN